MSIPKESIPEERYRAHVESIGLRLGLDDRVYWNAGPFKSCAGQRRKGGEKE